nr:putative reverse transcriptase domain, aspartic peptidase domain protein [Tanacetum cinerariifolium]
MDLTGVVAMTTIAAATTTTTLAVATGIPVMDVTKETGVISPTDLPIPIISALQARTLLYHGCEGFLATIHDMSSEVPSIHDQPIVSEFPDVFLDELPGIPL